MTVERAGRCSSCHRATGRLFGSALRLRSKISVTGPWWEPSIAAFRFGRLVQKFVAQFVYLPGRRKVQASATDFKATVRFLKEILLVFHGRLPSVAHP